MRIYDAPYAPSAWVDAMEVSRLTTSAAHTLILSQPQTEVIRFSPNLGSPTLQGLEGAFAEYNKLFARPEFDDYDAHGVRTVARSEVGKPILDTDIWDLDWLRERPEMQYNLRYGVYRKMYASISSDPLLYGLALFWYDTRFDEIPPEDVRTFSLLGPHMAKAYDLARFTDELRSRFNCVLAVLDRIDLGICLTDALGRIILANRAARELLERREEIWLDRSGQLRSRDPGVAAGVDAAVRDIARTAGGEGARSSAEFAIAKLDGEHVIVGVSPLRDAEMELERDLVGALLTMVDTGHAPRMNVAGFSAAHGLTPAEGRVAGHLCKGRSNPEIAEELGIAQSTVQSHVKSILQKTGAKGRMQLLWKVLQFSPPVS